MNRDTQLESKRTPFAGFGVPESNYFKMPKEWTDITCRLNSLAEVKVVEYILKHTWGYHEYALKKRITTDEFMQGRKRKDGSRIDQGTGLSAPAVRSGLQSAVAHGLIEEEVDARDRGRVKKSYALRMRGDARERAEENLSPDGKTFTIDGKDMAARGQRSYHRTEKETFEKNVTYNGDFFRQLPALKQTQAETEYVAQTILEQLGDEHSQRFYQLVAAKIPAAAIHRALAEIRQDGAEHPARLFTYKMKLVALQRLKKAVATG